MNYGTVALETGRNKLQSIVFKKIFAQIKPAVVPLANGFAYDSD